MCTRYSLAKSPEALSKRYGIKLKDPLKPRYNIAPTQSAAVITNRRADEFSFFRWGLIPNWSLDETGGLNLFNARGETLFTKTPFKHVVRSQRCLVPSDGFFEWKKVGKNKVPYRIMLASDEIFSLAGLWDSWENPKGEIVNSFTIVTVDANKLVAEVHDRMPVILTPETEGMWLNDKATDAQIQAMLKPFDPEKMSFYQAHRVVNSVAYDYPECIQMAPKIYPGESFSLFD
jgi:putative SOS response-associated peptidase YedK